MREGLEYAAAWGTLKFLGLLPRPVARWAAARFAAILFRVNPVWKSTALFNLRLAFPEWSEAERERIVQLMVRHLGWLMAEFAHLPRINRGNVAGVLVQDGFENFLAAERRGRGVLFLTGHLGAWELNPFAHALYHKPIHFLVRPIKNARVDALVNRYRGLSGNQPIEKNDSARAVLRALRDGGTVGILADQNTTPVEAVFVNFFGIPAATTAGLARLARRTGAAVVPAHGYWDPSLGKYVLHYEPALELRASEDEEADIRAHTELFNQALEGFIRQFPDHWFWVHRRWKNRPEGEAPIYADEVRNR
jgi:Kdo2-lipid IVA lauroyltransferase/acyltransferase